MVCRRNFSIVFIILLGGGLGWARTAGAQQLSSLYGSDNIQYVSLRYSPWLMSMTGSTYEVAFGFNTSSKKTENAKNWKYFYGVALIGGGFSWPNADLGEYKTRDAVAGYGLIQIENKIFWTTSGPIRPYFGVNAALGSGSLWMQRAKDLPDPPLPSLSMFSAGMETGLMFPLKGQYALSLAAAANVEAAQFGAEVRFYYPAMLTIGVSKWIGPMK